MHLKRWKLVKCNSRTGDEIPLQAPERLRTYWTLSGAQEESQRLNFGLRYVHSHWRYAVRRR